MLRKWLIASVAAIAVASTASCSSGAKQSSGSGQPSQRNQPMTLTIAVASPGLPFLQLYVADQQGFYKKRNLTVKFVSLDGSAAATAALQSGSADATVSLPEGAITAIAAGAPLKVIGTTVDQNLYSMYGSKKVSSLNDLAGKKIAILTEGNGTELLSRYLLDKKGAGADKSTYVATGALPNRLAAIQTGQVAGTLLFPPFDLTATKAGLPKLYDFRDLKEPYPNEVIAVSENSIKTNGKAIHAFMDSLAEASAFIGSDFNKAVTIGAKVTGSPEDVVKQSLTDMKDAFSKDLSVSKQSMQGVLDVMKKYSSVKNLPSADSVYDGEFIGS